jgi:hypothetical protein
MKRGQTAAVVCCAGVALAGVSSSPLPTSCQVRAAPPPVQALGQMEISIALPTPVIHASDGYELVVTYRNLTPERLRLRSLSPGDASCRVKFRGADGRIYRANEAFCNLRIDDGMEVLEPGEAVTFTYDNQGAQLLDATGQPFDRREAHPLPPGDYEVELESSQNMGSAQSLFQELVADGFVVSNKVTLTVVPDGQPLVALPRLRSGKPMLARVFRHREVEMDQGTRLKVDAPQPAGPRHPRNTPGGNQKKAGMVAARVTRNVRELVLVLSTDEDFLPIPQSAELWNPEDGRKTCPVSAKIVARKRDGSEVALREQEIAALVGRKVRIKMEASSFPGEDAGSTEALPEAGTFDFSLSAVKPDVLQQDLILETIPTDNGPGLQAVEGTKDVNGNGISDAGAVLFAHDMAAQARVTAVFRAPKGMPVRIEYQRPAKLQAPPGLWIPLPMCP